MIYLYGSKTGVPRRLVATFGSEQQQQAYTRWAILQRTGELTGKFEQGSVLAGFESWDASNEPLTDDDPEDVVHNPSPSML